MGLHASTAVRGPLVSERTATQADRESAGGCANATNGTIWSSPNKKSERSKSGRYPHSLSGALMELGVNKVAPIAFVLPGRLLRTSLCYE